MAVNMRKWPLQVNGVSFDPNRKGNPMADTRTGSTDVLIVGAGPVGLMLAAELQRHGATCRIVDRAPQPTDKSKAVVVHARTLEHLDHLELEQSFLAHGTTVHAVSFFVQSKRVVQLHFGGSDTRYPFVLCIPQSTTENLLGNRLAEAGLQVERRVEFIDFHQSDAGVTSRLRHASGSVEEVESRYLCGCDGSHSGVREGTGIAFTGLSYEEEWILADVQLQKNAFFARDEVSIFAEPQHFLAIFPLPGDRWRLIAVRKIADPTEAAAPATVEEFERLLLHHTGRAIPVFDPAWITPFRIGHKHADRLRAGRVFLCGDAAHIHSQVSGQGMNTGLQDAVNLGWKLGLACRGHAQPRLLDTYEEERLPVIRKVLLGTDLATRAVTLRHAVGQQTVNMLARLLMEFEPVHNYLTRTIAELSMNYRTRGYTSSFYSEHTERRAHRLRHITLPGDHAPRAPDLVILPDRKAVRLYDLLRHVGHSVVFMQGERQSDLTGDEVVGFARELHTAFEDELHFIAVRLRDTWKPTTFDFCLVEDVADEMHLAYDAETPTVYVIRPDNYIAFRSDWGNRTALIPFLNAYLR
jgi:2-polyprenyl-6-methoxyphenol hydroxylase-like FAD-dependent oxidoreductase